MTSCYIPQTNIRASVYIMIHVYERLNFVAFAYWARKTNAVDIACATGVSDIR